jgi:hypothetical protein
MTILFLTYVNRSGSTYLSNILSSSDDVCVCPEGDLLVRIFLEDPGRKIQLTSRSFEKIAGLFREDHKMRSWDLNETLHECLENTSTNIEAFAAVLNCYRNAFKPGAVQVLFKAERLPALMERIRRAAGDVGQDIRFLSLVRDPRAVIASQKLTRITETGKIMAGNVVVSARKWTVDVRRVMNHQATEDDTMIIKYESLIEETGRNLKRISAFCSVDLTGCLPEHGDLETRLAREERRIHSRIGMPPDPGRIKAWANSLATEDIYLIERLAASVMSDLGYSLFSSGIRWKLELFRVYSLSLHFVSAMLEKIRFRLKKNKNLV